MKSAEVLGLEAQLKYYKDTAFLRRFVEEFKNRLGTLAANTPYEDWPEAFKEAFSSLEREGQVTSAELYKSYLPKN